MGGRPFVTSIVPEVAPFETALSLQISQSQTVAAAGDIGRFFQYKLKDPVELRSGRSAMLPIQATEADAEIVSLYTTGATQMLHAVILKNNTQTHWAAGPVTVYNDDIYSGEAQISHCAPGNRRIISHAADLTVESDQHTSKPQQKLTKTWVEDATLNRTFNIQRQHLYRFLSLDGQSKVVLLEHTLEGEWRIDESKSLDEVRIETTETHVRYKFPIFANKPVTVTVPENHDKTQSRPLSTLSLPEIQAALRETALAADARPILQSMQKTSEEIALHQKTVAQLNGESQTLNSDQSRIRENMKQLDRESELYRSYVAKLTEHEKQFQTLRDQLATATQQLEKAKQAWQTTTGGAYGDRGAPDPFGPKNSSGPG